jgi:hypothetical protein
MLLKTANCGRPGTRFWESAKRVVVHCARIRTQTRKLPGLDALAADS